METIPEMPYTEDMHHMLPEGTATRTADTRKGKWRRIFPVVVLLALLTAVAAFFAVAYGYERQQATSAQAQLAQVREARKTAQFLELFTQKVLESNQQVSLEDRLQLENAVRGLNDPNILSAWGQFTAATNESDIQIAAKNLLTVLAQKIAG